jgi:DDE superfamily endonuclease
MFVLFSTRYAYIHEMSSPQNKEELFNLCHVQARNVIKCIFGVLKKCFHILLIGPEYDIMIQVQILAALCALHNFICIHDPQEEELAGEEYPNQGGHTGDGFV